MATSSGQGKGSDRVERIASLAARCEAQLRVADFIRDRFPEESTEARSVAVALSWRAFELARAS